ncbi:MAG: RHS repeat-associated core domain-containing protein [Deltaproteobacteria bacterium]|nr:RHS repeat-associated core domain-containing protein [Deltaproteobacteria bacterium]
MTNNDGVEIETTEYMPFGSQRNHSGTDASAYKFTDQELDSENGLYNYNARLYDPFIGRFISPDTIIPQPYNPQSLNRYSYCLNNPLRYTDPSGHEEDDEGYLDEVVVTAPRLYWFDSGWWSGWVTRDQYFYYMSLYSTSAINPYEYQEWGQDEFYLGGSLGGLKAPRRAEATGEKIVFIGITPGVSSQFRDTSKSYNAKYERYFQEWKNHPNVTIDEGVNFRGIINGMNEHLAGMVMAHANDNGSGAIILEHMGKYDRHFSNFISYRDNFKATYMGIAICNSDEHFKSAKALMTSSFTVENLSAPAAMPGRSDAEGSLDNIYNAVNKILSEHNK